MKYYSSIVFFVMIRHFSKIIFGFLLSIITLCSGCSGENLSNKNIASVSTAGALPVDFQVIQENILFYDSLNLDGIGTYDDRLYISLYRWCANTAVIVLQIKLGTGEVIATVIPSDGYFDNLYFGNLFSLEKEAVVVQVGVPGSNYGASKLYVYDIYGAGEVEPAPSIVEKFNCAGSDMSAPTIDADISKDDIVIMGTKITEIEGYPLEGIKLSINNNSALNNNFETVVYWKENGWFAIK